MTVSTRRVWRAAPTTLVLVWVFTLAAVGTLVVLAYLVHALRHQIWLPTLLGLLTLATVLYAWRFGLHPQLRATDRGLVVRNPFRTHSFAWEDLTVVAPGENGLVVGSEHGQVEAWCIQQPGSATRRGRRTRSDRIVAELLDLQDVHEPPVTDPRTAGVIRRARPDEGRLLAQLERAASEGGLGHIFPADKHPYPTSEVVARWRRLLRDRLVHVHVLDTPDGPVGYLAYDAHNVLHLGVVPGHTRRGYGSALLDLATAEIFGQGEPTAQLWVLTDNRSARAFYRSHGWCESEERRPCEFPPYPEELRMFRPNPAAPRRRLAA
jgi:ribosomal protein S18 acetylase RimI-like enzyme